MDNIIIFLFQDKLAAILNYLYAKRPSTLIYLAGVALKT